MLSELRVVDLALIADASLEFTEGLNVLSGETGAGKTALLNALKLIIGERADSAMVRDGCEGASAQALFYLDDAQVEELRDRVEAEDGTLVVRRKLSKDGRSRCSVNDEMVSVKGLANSAGTLVDLHGQHEHQALLSPQSHIGYLDRWAYEEIAPLKGEYQAALESYEEAAEELAAARKLLEVSDFQFEQAQFIDAQIAAVNPLPGELDEFEEMLPVLRNGESLSEAASVALGLLKGDGGILDSLSEANSALFRASSDDKRLSAYYDVIERCLVSLEDLAMELRSYRDSVEFDPQALDRALERLGALDGLVRRFGPSYADVLARWDEAKAILGSSEDAGERILRLELSESAAKSLLCSVAEALEAARTSAAERFCKALESNVADLAMEGAVFSMREEPLDSDSWTMNGSKRYELLYAPARNLSPRPLAKIASGGELSRVMLALECILDADRGKTLVFDEVDAGIGGATANAVASRLVELASSHQVIVVTHLAQIAAKADAHFLVEKRSEGGFAETSIKRISGASRENEIARMLSGSVDETSIAHARAMLG
ncbi:MAG: DNA repair protein RecN [Coriobacteriales bacterium]|nr:DNA repair protein RecN [Coriobacteriales bacterium]